MDDGGGGAGAAERKCPPTKKRAAILRGLAWVGELRRKKSDTVRLR